MRHLRTSALAALLLLTAAGVTAAQTVTVTRAAGGSSVDVVFDGTKIGSAIADTRGVATIDTNKLPDAAQERSVRLAVDLCKDLVHVQMIDAGVMAPPDAGCTRRDITGLYVMRHVTSFVIDVGQPTPSLWVAQGPAPKPWLDPTVTIGGDVRTWDVLPKGLVIGGGGGLTHFSNVVKASCGNVAECSRKTGQWSGLDASATIWMTRWLGAEIGMLKPPDVKVAGTGTNDRFETTLETRMLTLAGKVGGFTGPVRVYGFAGMNYHWITSNTSETIDPSTVTVDGTAVTVPGGTQTFGFSAPGWGWLAGGGMEIWMKRRFGIFAEMGFVPLKEKDELGGEARIDDRVIYLIGGIRIHVVP